MIGKKALIPNKHLKPFEVLIGNWQVTGSHPYLPGEILQGRTSFQWHEGGAFIIMRSEIDNPKIPQGVAIFGSDDSAQTFFMLYFDERGVSRKQEIKFEKNQIIWWRDDPKFSQRMVLTIEENGDKMTAQGKMSRDGGAWEDDIRLVYTRIK